MNFLRAKKNRDFLIKVSFVGLAATIFSHASYSDAKRAHPESWYRDQWCGNHGGQIEVILADQTRCDCETSTHAIEVDFADKWAEAIGQALHYSKMTGKRAGIVLIIESETDMKSWKRLTDTIKHFDLPIDMWREGNVVEKEEMPSMQ